nr:hypothetical protein [Tanacetum cinerariifolium]
HTSGDAGASTGGKSLAALQGLLDRSTLAVEVGITTAETMPFVTSYVTPTPKREGGNTDSVSGPNIHTHHPSKRFVISSDSSHHSTTNAADAEVTSLVRSFVSPPPVMTATVTTTNVVGASSASVLGAGAEPVSQVQPKMDSETLSQIYVPKWNVVNESVLDDPDVYRSVIDQLAPSGLFSQLRSMDYDQLFSKFNVGAETKTTKAIHFRSQFSVVEAAEAARLTRDLSSLELSCDELSVKAASLESQRDGFTEQVCLLETTCSGLRDQVFGYELFKEQCEAIQDEQVKVLSNRVAGLDSKLMALALHLDEEFYPCFPTTIAGRQWILGHRLRLAVMKCLQSPECATTFGMIIGLAIDKGIQIRFVAGIEHGKARRDLADIFAYDPSMEVMYVFAILTFRDLDFNLLSQLKSQKDDSIADIISLLRLEGPSAEIPEKLKEGAFSYRLSISDVVGVVADSLSSINLIGEAGTSGVPVTADATTALTISVTAANINSIPSISVVDYDMADAGV